MKTIKQAIAEIRALDMSVRIDQGEWRVTFPPHDMPDAKRREDVAAYCYDASDAIDTARVMRERFEQTNPPVWRLLNHIGG